MTTTEEDDRPALPHPICGLLRELRLAAGMSLGNVETLHGMSAVVVGSYERGNREPPVGKLEKALNIYGYTLRAVPLGAESIRLPSDIVADLRSIADQLESKQLGVIDVVPAMSQPATQSE